MESLWERKKGAVIAEIKHRVDDVYGLSLYHRRYDVTACEETELPPIDGDWLGANILASVEGSLSGTPSYPDTARYDLSEHGHCDPDWDTEMSQAWLSFSRRAPILAVPASEDHLGDYVAGVLSHPWINKGGMIDSQSPEYRAKIDLLLRERIPAQFVLPSFPFKDQNPFRTNVPASYIDLGDIVMLIRLHLIDLAIQETWHGADWIVVTDGMFLAPVFGVSEEDAEEYRETLRSWRNALNLYQGIHIVDLKDLVRLIPEYEETYASVRKRLPKVLAEPNIRDAFTVLCRGMRNNLNLRNEFEELGDVSLCRVLNETLWVDHKLKPAERTIRARINERSEDAAFDYTALNLAVRAVKLYERLFPQAFRATVHPKPGQIAISPGPKSEQYPWNGVPFVADGDGCLVERTAVVPLWKIQQEPNIEPVHHSRHHHDFPFYYRKAT